MGSEGITGARIIAAGGCLMGGGVFVVESNEVLDGLAPDAGGLAGLGWGLHHTSRTISHRLTPFKVCFCYVDNVS